MEAKNLHYYDIEKEPFRIYGVWKENGKFRRIPEEVAEKVSKEVYKLHTNTAGGRVRFVTDSACVSIRVKLENIRWVGQMSATGGAGLDLYAIEEDTETYIGTFVPPYNVTDGYEGMLYFSDKKERVITVNLPLFCDVLHLEIGLEADASIKRASDYIYETPVVCYGSSITQGGFASRPGNCYEHILTRQLDCNIVNLGFAGSAMAEEAITEYIKKLPMQVFILDYDNNAPGVEYLEATHRKMFQAVRKEQPDLPIIILSRPKYYLSEEEKKRLEVIRSTYEEAVKNGDKNVYLLDGPTLMKGAKDDGTIDNCHPNDAGFANMAQAILPVLKGILEG